MNGRLLICTVLDHTLIPNGSQPESPGARRTFTALSWVAIKATGENL